jgi:galactokinase
MTGAGFGGCALALVRADSLEGFKEQASKTYLEKTKISPVFYQLV